MTAETVEMVCNISLALLFMTSAFWVAWKIVNDIHETVRKRKTDIRIKKTGEGFYRMEFTRESAALAMAIREMMQKEGVTVTEMYIRERA
jgi:hypothetical protein